MNEDYDNFWSRNGLPTGCEDEFSAWILAARVSSINGGAPARAAVSAFLQGVQPEELRGVLGDDGIQYSAAITGDMRRAIVDGDRRFPGLRDLLWRGNVIHGEQVLNLAPKGCAVFPQDAGDVLRRLWQAGALSPTKFQPSHSGAAFLGLSPAYRGPQDTPSAATAAHWCWEVMIDAPQESSP